MSNNKTLKGLGTPSKLAGASGDGTGVANTSSSVFQHHPAHVNESITTEETLAKKIKIDPDYTRSVKLQTYVHWFVDFPWLTTADSLLKCSICVDAQKRNVFTTGKNMSSCKPKRDDLVKHEKTSDHKDAASRPQATAIFQFESVRSAILAQMKTLLVQFTNGIPISKNLAFVELQVMNGVSVLKDLQTEEWLSHSSYSESINDIQQTLAAIVKEELENKRQSRLKFYSIIIDEITDIAQKPMALVYVRFITLDGDVETQFLGVVEFENVANVHSAIKKMLDDHRLVSEQMVALVVDGASIMSDAYRGVTARFKEDIPHLIVGHCLGHRLPLAVGKVAWGVPYLSKYENILRLFSTAMKSSPSFMRSLSAAPNLRDGDKLSRLRKALMPEKFSLSNTVQLLADSLATILRCLADVLVEPDVEGKCLLESLVTKMLTYRFVMMTLFLADAAGVLEVLTASMLCEDVSCVQLMHQFEAAQLAVRNLLTNPAQHIKRANEQFPMESGTCGFSTYCGHNVKDSLAERHKFKANAEVFIADLGHLLETMFPETDLLYGFGALSPKACDSGEAQLSTLVNHFPGFIDGATALLEWSLLKQVIRLEQHRSSDLRDFFARFIHDNLQAYPNLGLVAAIGVAIPFRTPECKRGVEAFIAQAADTTDVGLLADVEDRMMLAIHAKPLDAFNFDAAFKIWTTAMDQRCYEEVGDWEITKN